MCRLPKEGHLSILVEGSTSSVVCQKDQPTRSLTAPQLGFPGHLPCAGLNGCEVPHDNVPVRVTSQRCNHAWRCKPVYLPVDIPVSTMKGHEFKAPSPGSHSIPILTASPIRAPPPKAEGQVCMTTEVRELLSWVVLDTSGHGSGSSTPKSQEPMVLVTPLHPKTRKISPNQVDYILPSGCPRWCQNGWSHPWRRSMPPAPIQSKPQGPAATSLP